MIFITYYKKFPVPIDLQLSTPTKTYFMFDIGTTGGIVCQGQAYPHRKLYYYIEESINWWYAVDYNPETATESFSG